MQPPKMWWWKFYKTPWDRSEQQYKNNLKNSVGYYPFTANAGTPIGEWEIGVQGEVAASGGGNMFAASEFVKLKVEEPYLSMKINMAAIERGQSGDGLWSGY